MNCYCLFYALCTWVHTTAVNVICDLCYWVLVWFLVKVIFETDDQLLIAFLVSQSVVDMGVGL